MTPYSALAGGRLARLLGETSRRLQEDSYARLKYDTAAGQDSAIIDSVIWRGVEQGGKALPERPFPCDGGIVNVAGAGIFVLFAVRHILNWRWYKNIFQGKYLLLLCLFFIHYIQKIVGKTGSICYDYSSLIVRMLCIISKM